MVWKRTATADEIVSQPVLESAYSKLRAAGHLPAHALPLLSLFVVPFVIYWPNLTDFFALDDYIWLKAASNPDPADFFRRAFAFPSPTSFEEPTPSWRPWVSTTSVGCWGLL